LTESLGGNVKRALADIRGDNGYQKYEGRSLPDAKAGNDVRLTLKRNRFDS
jgi:hypothetical protein